MTPSQCQSRLNLWLALPRSSTCATSWRSIWLGTLVGLAGKVGMVRPDGSIPRMREAMMSDANGTTCGALMGSSTIALYIESASGIAEGGRSGLTALFVGLLFVVSVFLSPLFLLIPSAATSGALVMVGVLMVD